MLSFYSFSTTDSHLSEEFYHFGKEGYEAEVREFKRFLVTRALRAANGKKTDAARLLGFAKHQNLSDILKKQFPGLYEELGFTARKSRSDRSVFINPNDIKKTVEAKTNAVKPSVSRLDLGKRMLQFSWHVENYATFYFDVNTMQFFGFPEGAVVIVVLDSEIIPGRAVVALDGDKFVFGVIQFDTFANVYFLEWDGETIFLTEDNVFGYPVGYQSLAEAKAEIVEFIKI
ncbi:MAG: hypothetical protein LUM44_19500 [Pyrinomonadaceae bacterium]|nr:hypothetical protein [Pyrinomonadaceae bacterium]